MERVKTGIHGLDEMLSGGFLPETANLVEGAPGTGKTTLGMQFIYNGATQFDQPGLILTFEEFPRQYYRDALSFGWDFKALEAQNKLRVVMTSPEVTKLDLQRVNGQVERMAAEIGAQRILIDSLSHFERMTTDPIELRGLVFEFINALKRLNFTCVLTRENPALLGEPGDVEDSGLAFVVDSYILLRYVEIESAVHKALLVLKLRGSNHDKEIREFTIGPDGMEVKTRFEDQEGIFTGTPRRRMRDAFAQAFPGANK
ncbi:MAG: ATPase [Anaerolineae bacterium]|nr:ATPase [Anaerolineae bacterium]